MSRAFRVVTSALSIALFAGCELGEKKTVQLGYRGVGQELTYDVSRYQQTLAAHRSPVPLPPASTESPPAVWQNVQVLNDISALEFNRTMVAITEWVSPKQGCAYCHVGNDFASDAMYQKVVARRMLEMTRRINAEYKSHVKGTGVTCYTCHAGQNVPPAGLWTATTVNQYHRAYLDREDVRVQSTTVEHSNANRSSIKQTENTYALMLDVSKGVGANCTFCHNSRAWASWENAPPSRITAMYGFRMVRDLNTNYVQPLTPLLPANRLGVNGDVLKMSCGTCHQGLSRPMGGVSLAAHYPALWGSPVWERGGSADSALAGYRDLRGANMLPQETAPRPLSDFINPLPAPQRGGAPQR